MSQALLIVLGLLLAVWVWRDFKDYPRFKAYTDTRERQRVFARWLGFSFALFTLGSVGCLALIGRLTAIFAPPFEFAPLLNLLKGQISAGFLEGMAASLIAGIVVMSYIGARAAGKATKQVVIGDIMALMPRNRAEYGYVAALSVNAGVGEELFFRLLLPLLLTSVIGNAMIATVIAAIVFGFAHLYQGVAGVIVTGVIGAAMSAIYLATGSIVWPILVHGLIDLRGLVLQPALTDYFRKRQTTP